MSDSIAILPRGAVISLPELIPGVADAAPTIAMSAFETLPQTFQQSQLTADNWNTGVSGNWTKGSDWSTGSVPTASSTATIAVAGTYTVTINSSVAANSLTIDDAHATVADTNGGTLAITTTLAITAGTFSLGSGSTLSGGTVSLGSSGVFKAAGGTLDGVTYRGVLNLSAADAILYGMGNLTFEGSGGTGGGTINLTGKGAALLYSGSGILKGATINIGSTSASYLDGTGGTLTLGTGTTLVQDGTAYLGDDEGGEKFVNQGTITAGYAAGYFGVDGPGLTNAGTIAVSNGDTFDMSSLASFTNTGTMTATGTGTVLSFGGPWTNSGSISVSNGALLNLGGTFSTPSLAGINVSTGGILNITGDLTNTGATLSLGSGSALGAVALSGTITGGTITDAGGGLLADNGTLNGVTYQGVLDLSASNALLFAAGSLDVEAAGGGSGTINLTGNAAALIYTGTASLDNVTVDLGSINGSYLDGESGTLTLGSAASLVQTGAEAYLGDYANAETFVNLGTVTAGYSGGYFNIAGPGFSNAGKIAVSNGDTADIFSTSWTNTATISATGSGTVLSFGGSWTNSGSVSVEGNALLNLAGSFSTSSLSSVTLGTGAALEISGDLSNTGATLIVGTGSEFGAVSLSGTITGGTIVDGGGGIVADYGTLNGVSYQGVLTLSAANAVLYGMGNLSFEGSGGNGAGTIDLTGNGATLIYVGSGNLNNVTINIGSTDGSYLDGNGGTLTFGSGTNLIQAGAEAYLGEVYNAESFVNLGALIAGYSSGSFSISGPGFTNAGSITVANGDKLDMAALSAFTNLENSTLTGGSYEVDAGSTFQLPNNATIVTDAATIILSGDNAVITTLNTTTNEKIKIDQTLLTIADGGTLELLAGRDFAPSAAFTDNGLLQLGGGAFTADSDLNIGSAGSFSGYGTVDGAVADAGSITANGGTLNFSGAVTGSGGLGAAAGATIDLKAGGRLSGKISGAGMLKLDGATACTISAAALSISQIRVDAGATLSGSGTVQGSLTDAGTVNAAGGTLTLGSFTGVGALTAASGAVLELTAGGALSIAISGGGTLQLDGSTAYTLAGVTLAIAALTLDSGATVSGRGSIASAVANSGTITASGGKLILSGQITGSGVLQAAAAQVLDLTAGQTLNEAVSGAGRLELGGAFLLGSGALSIAAVSIDAGASLSGAGSLTSSIDDSGTLAAAGGTLTVKSAISGAGTLSAGAGAVLNLVGGGSFSGTLGGIGTVDISTALIIDQSTAFSAATIEETADVALDANAPLSLAAGAVLDMTAASGATVDLHGPSTSSFTNNGRIAGNGAGTAELAVAVINNANVSVGSGTLSFLSSLTNDGSIDAAAGTLSVKATVGGTGTLQVGATGTMSLLLGAGAGQTVDFLASTGLLNLTNPIDFNGVISGFGGNDVIDLLKTKETSYGFSNNVLTISDGTTTEASLHFSSGYALADFSVSSDLNGGTFVKFV